ncbi:MAG: glycosyltransferase family 2 protein [Caldilineaceae bacterium]
MSQYPSVAMVLCVRNEETFLQANLAYHYAMGVARAYVFTDRCTDKSAVIAAAFPWVKVIDQPRRLEDKFVRFHMIRCTNAALAMAREEGFDWLLFIDPDEFACGDERGALAGWAEALPLNQRATNGRQKENLPAMLAQVDPKVEQVMLRTREVVPVAHPENEPFWKWHYFQVRGALKRPILLPKTGEVRELTEWLGHQLGKSIIRTSAAAQCYSPHEWEHIGDDRDRSITSPLRPLQTEWRGIHYHFPVVSARHWLHKYRIQSEEPPVWSSTNAPVEFPVQAWKEAATTMTEGATKEYFDRWIVTPRQRLIAPLLRGEIVYDPWVDRVLTKVLAQ